MSVLPSKSKRAYGRMLAPNSLHRLRSSTFYGQELHSFTQPDAFQAHPTICPPNNSARFSEYSCVIQILRSLVPFKDLPPDSSSEMKQKSRVWGNVFFRYGLALYALLCFVYSTADLYKWFTHSTVSNLATVSATQSFEGGKLTILSNMNEIDISSTIDS
ncbi:hypothetical protein DL96DRAFT_1142791 [Flagelloscypha sp. PMI_526]|nr:hypothetical protein DL96DRAFT_1142791 [Flagelloscypha sp. PMI_526]